MREIGLLDIEERARLRGAPARPLGRRRVANHCDRLPGQADTCRDGAKASAVGAPDLREAITEPYINHRHVEKMPIFSSKEGKSHGLLRAYRNARRLAG